MSASSSDALGGRRRQPLVPEQDGQRREPAEVAREGARGLGARALRAVEVDGQPDHEAADAVLLRQLQQAPRRRPRTWCARSVVSPEAMVRVTSERARPTVLVPTSMPIRRAPAGRALANASGARTLPRLARWLAGVAAHCANHDPCCGDAAPYTPRRTRRGQTAAIDDGAKERDPRMKIIWYRTFLLPPRDRQQRHPHRPLPQGQPDVRDIGHRLGRGDQGRHARGADARPFRPRRRRGRDLQEARRARCSPTSSSPCT